MEGAAQQALSHLSELLLTPVADLLDRERLLVVGDGALEYVPFSALPRPSASWEGGPEPMISRFEIVRLPAVSLLAGLRQRRESSPPRRGALAVLADPVFEIDDPRVERQPTIHAEPLSGPEAGGDGGDVDAEGFRRLPGSRSEAEAILRRVAPEERFLALDFEASRDTVLNGTLRGYPIVHIATHAVVDPVQPELSGIVLSLVDKEGRRQEGFLRVHEIYGLDLPAELVVLSGCRTALGRELDGEGLIGLTRAFMFAGTRRLVVSLWRIDDQATAKLMDRFYGEMLGHGQAPSTALRLAQLSVAREPRWRASFYWASFVLLGDWRRLPNP
jgi:CHAT domain-containing protein